MLHTITKVQYQEITSDMPQELHLWEKTFERLGLTIENMKKQTGFKHILSISTN